MNSMERRSNELGGNEWLFAYLFVHSQEIHIMHIELSYGQEGQATRRIEPAQQLTFLARLNIFGHLLDLSAYDR